ncbi:MAG: LacI family DNA-binding transcriptional regulator [Betaproteobacteria bacterium]|nr:MAG: LacI family DNA-binding transcriptional regulator [Betaproteobacteria bacterium]
MPRARGRTTIVDVAREAAVSITTVSHALSGQGFVDPATRARVKEVARRLGYRPNVHAQRLRKGGAHTIVLLSSMPFAVAAGPSRLGFLMEIAAVAATAALTRGLALVLVPPTETELPLDSLDIDGALVIEPSASDANVDYLKKRVLPVVAIGKQPDATTPYVDLHSYATAQLLLAHLRRQGARRIALLIGSERRNSYVETEQAYRAFIREHPMPVRLARASESGGESAGYAEASRLLAQDPAIDAICAPVDAFAVGAVRAASEFGRNVPDDVKIVTRYDGLRARNCTPPLTAVDLHLDRLAALAVDLLFEHLRGESAARARVAGPEPTLVPRESSAASSPAIERGRAA